MLLSEIPKNSKVFIDSNIFIYHFTNFEKYSNFCISLMRKIVDGDILGYASTVVASEILHRLMILEATKNLGIHAKDVLFALKKNPDKLALFTEHLNSVSWIESLGITLLPFTVRDLHLCISIKQRYNLLTNDAINLAIMLNNNIQLLAANDSDFNRVDAISICMPFE